MTAVCFQSFSAHTRLRHTPRLYKVLANLVILASACLVSTQMQAPLPAVGKESDAFLP